MMMMSELTWYLEALANRSLRHPEAERPGQAPAAASFDAGPDLATSSEGAAIIDFWRDAGAERWFAKDADFDRGFRGRFLASHEAAARGELREWIASPSGALGLVLLLDQFPRNAFRGTSRMYGTDALAHGIAGAAIDAGHDREVQGSCSSSFYLPFAHSEVLADQERSVALSRRSGSPTSHTPKATVTSSGASGAFHTATRS